MAVKKRESPFSIRFDKDTDEFIRSQSKLERRTKAGFIIFALDFYKKHIDRKKKPSQS